MALDTAFFSLFPEIYHPEFDKTSETEHVEDKPKTEKVVPKDFDCLRFLMETFENKCMPFSEYGLGHVKYIVQFCESSSTSEIVDKAMDMGNVCNNLII